MQLYFDTIIFGFLALDLILIIWLIWNQNHYSALKTSLIILASIAWVVIFYGSFVEPQIIVIRKKQIKISEQSESSLNLAVISDIHLGPYKGSFFAERVVNKIEELNPDAVLMVGDFVYLQDDISNSDDFAPLKNLADNYPVYAALGNHDYDLYASYAVADDKLGRSVADTLENLGIEVLINEGEALSGLWIAGVDDYWTRRADIKKALAGRESDIPVILMSHNPDYVNELSENDRADLILSGHTHGGQIRLPLIGPIGIIPTELGQSYDQGLFQINNRRLYITSGLGESGPRARLFNPPEITMLEVSY